MSMRVNQVTSRFGNIFSAFSTNIIGYFDGFFSKVLKGPIFLLVTFMWAVVKTINTIVINVINMFIDYCRSTADAVSLLAGEASQAGGGLGDFLDKVNVYFPVAESLVLATTLLSLWVAAVILRVWLAIWKAIPFKAS